MSELKQTPDHSSSDDSAVVKAIAVLADAARKDFASVEAQLKAAGFGITGYQPLQAKPDLDVSVASDIGTVIQGRGVYHGAWQPRPNGVIVHAYSDTDLLKDASGQQMLLTWYAARDELATRNGRRYGDGTEAAMRQALAKPVGTQGAYQDGDLVMAPQVLLNGRDMDGDKVRVQNTADLLSASRSDAFKNIAETLRSGPDGGRWSWSCSEGRFYSSYVRAVRLSVGNDVWDVIGYVRLGVLPFRFFREPHVVRAVSRLSI